MRSHAPEKNENGLPMSPDQLRRLMHVDDEDDIREVTNLALDSIGNFTVCSCKSGADALATVAGFAPQMILLDVMMPVMSGPDVLRALRKTAPGANVPVVFMTARVQSKDIDALKDLGAIDVIRKPFDPLALSDQVAKIWARHVGS
jgi:two-component system, OmpR family, response regulator